MSARQMNLHSTIAPCLQPYPRMAFWPEEKPWPKHDGSLAGAGQQPVHRTFDQRLHGTNVGPQGARVHSASTSTVHVKTHASAPTKGVRISDTSLSAHGLLPGTGTLTRAQLANMGDEAAVTATSDGRARQPQQGSLASNSRNGHITTEARSGPSQRSRPDSLDALVDKLALMAPKV